MASWAGLGEGRDLLLRHLLRSSTAARVLLAGYVGVGVVVEEAEGGPALITDQSRLLLVPQYHVVAVRLGAFTVVPVLLHEGELDLLMVHPRLHHRLDIPLAVHELAPVIIQHGAGVGQHTVLDMPGSTKRKGGRRGYVSLDF